MSGEPDTQARRGLACLLSFQVISGLLVAPVFALFPVYVESRLHLTSDFSGLIRGLFVLASAVTAFLGGALCDAIGRKPAYLLGMTGVISAGALFMVPHPAWMYPLALYGGVMFGLGSVAGQSYLMDAAPRRSLALATAGFFTAGTLGNAVGSSISGEVVRLSPEAGYWLLGVAMAAGHSLLLLVAWRLLPEIVRAQAEGPRLHVLAGLGGLMRRPATWFLLGLRYLPTAYWGITTLLMPLLLFRATGKATWAGNYTAASLVLSAACQVGAGRLVDRFGPRVPMLVAISLVTVGTIGQWLCAGNPWALSAWGLLGAGAAWSLSITMTTLVRELSTEDTRGSLLGLTHTAWSAGFLTGTLAGGFAARQIGHGAEAFLVGAGCCAAAVLCAIGVAWALPGQPSAGLDAGAGSPG